MESLLIGLVTTLILINIRTMFYIRKGRRDEFGRGWLSQHLGISFSIGLLYTIVHFFVTGLVFIPEGPAFTGHFSMFLFLGGGAWFINMLIMAVIINNVLEDYVEYKKDCLRLGLDTRDYVNKFFVLTQKTGYSVKEEAGLRYDTNVNLYRVTYNKCWLGEYPKMQNRITLATLPQIHLQKSNIQKYVADYFSSQGQYLVEGDELKVVEDKPMEVMFINEKGE